MPTLTQLNYAVAVDTHRHFGKAAKACHISQPTLSMQLQKLEEELGTSLFDRNMQPIIPTAKGVEVLKQARIILAELKKLEFISKHTGTAPKGDFHLGVIPTLAPYLVPLFISAFSKKYPGVNLFVHEMKTEEIVTSLESDKIDAGLLVTPLHHSLIQEQPLFYEPFLVFVNPSHPYYKKSRIHESDLDPQGIWLLSEGHCMRNQVVHLCARPKSKHSPFPNVQFVSGDIETLQRLVQYSGGYTLIPYLAAYKEKSSEIKKMIRPLVAPTPSREISLVFARSEHKREILQALSETILAQVPKELPREASQKLEIIAID